MNIKNILESKRYMILVLYTRLAYAQGQETQEI